MANGSSEILEREEEREKKREKKRERERGKTLKGYQEKREPHQLIHTETQRERERLKFASTLLHSHGLCVRY